jgi:MoxR-like ATPase
MPPLQSIDATAALLAGQNCVADRQFATAVFLALKLKHPLFLEGEPGTGKTEIAKVLAAGLDAELIRLQ